MKSNDPLRRALKNVRLVEPTPELEARLLRALVDAERQENAAAQERRRKRSTKFSHLRLSLPALASMAIAAHLVLLDPTGGEEPFVEHRIELPDEGHAALPLILSLDQHDAEFASVRMDLPHGLKVSPTSQVLHTAEPSCHSAGCVYEFLHPTTAEAPPLEVHVEKPGMYRVEVEHASDSKRLREIIVVHASR
ncbi:MAG: hypothetical protein QM778_02340 [Myxococcales bacterium]